VQAPPITITCDCGAVENLGYGERWQCEECGKTWDTRQIPQGDYDALLRGLKRYRLLVLLPPLLLAAVLVPLTVLAGLQFAFLLFVFVMGYALLVVPQLRRSATARMRESTMRWKLRPE
jgi:hypothetical protein